MLSVKEYVHVEYLGEKQIVPDYQYVCYASNYDIDAVGLHELYKQRSTSEFCNERDQSKLVLNWRAKKQNLQSETRIEQVKGHTMAGTTLTDNFWANDILWQLNVLAYNLSVMMRQKKSKFKNTGTGDLIIHSVSSSCGCTVPKFKKKPIPLEVKQL